MESRIWIWIKFEIYEEEGEEEKKEEIKIYKKKEKQRITYHQSNRNVRYS